MQLDSAFLRRLENLSLRARRTYAGQQRAERRSRRRGASLEFADYRNYTPGDDLRSLDWNLYGRLDRFYVRLYEEEEELPVHLVLDGSASMRWQPAECPRPSKFEFARQLAAALAYVALAHHDHVALHWLDASLHLRDGSADAGRGKTQFHRALRFLRADAAAGADGADLGRSLRQLPARARRRGLVVVLSDLLDPRDAVQTALEGLVHQGFELQLIQILDPAELTPELRGDLRLTDAEGGAPVELASDDGLLREYRAAVETYLDNLARFAGRRRIPYLRVLTSESFEDAALRGLRAAGLVR
ncbi:MAG: DUF58 domain-containing protein [Verrucomicrobia bacterium]|nr:DUF58 domain-containing protein [Verrucomicrobiota bacterium]